MDNKFTIRFLVIFLGLFFWKDLCAQFILSGEIRPRTEYRHGFQTLPDSTTRNAIFTEQRTRLKVDFSTDKAEYKLVLQDVRVWGSQRQLVGNQDFATSVHEAFAVLKFNAKWSFKFGRQEMIYDDHRILGNVEWAQQARSHDAALFRYTGDKLKVHIGGAYNQNGIANFHTSYNIPNSYKSMQIVWANYSFTEAFSASFLTMSLGQQVNLINKDSIPSYHDNYTLTAGTRMMYKKNKLEASSNLFVQVGNQPTWPAKKTEGWLANLDVFYTITEKWKVGAGFEGISGNSQTDTTKAYQKVQHAFNPYFGTNHKFNGEMDYFYVGNHIGNVGLYDIYFSVKHNRNKFFVSVVPHVFLSQGTVLDKEHYKTHGEIKAMNPHLATEIDFTGGFKFNDEISCQLGYAQMFATPTMQVLKGGDYTMITNWAWLMLTYKPVFFKHDFDKKQG